nr:NADH dehydrogenase subunit 5 [Polydesmus sp. GZCS-2019]
MMFWLMKLIFIGLIISSLGMLYVGVTMVGLGAVIFDWVFLRMLGMDMGVVFLMDWMSMIFAGVVFLISGCVFFYMVGYMEGDSSIVRFGLLVLLFVLSMFFVIVSPSFIMILLGWDGLGLVSYCLVIYYGNYNSYNAGMITGVSNRIGDVGLLLAIGLLFMYGGWDFYLVEGGSSLWLYISVFIVLAGFTKSAQIPFSAWLPAAMAAPTPVSALVHSSTLVTAGVYLFIRFYGVLGEIWWLMLIILYGGSLTLFMAGLSANFEQDMKKIIALSTLSQLGVMMVSIGVGNVGLAFFHLVCHAIFKALLFLCGGKMIHSFSGNQDVRFMGGIIMGLPLSCVMLNVANFSLCGLPFMAGFYSKDMILESWGIFGLNFVCMGLVVVGTMLTCVYTAKFCWFSMISYYGGGGYMWDDNDMFYLFPMSVLSVGGVIGGSVVFWLGVPSMDLVYVFGFYKIWPFLAVMLGGGLSLSLLYYLFMSTKNVGLSDYWFSMWFLPKLSVKLIDFPLFVGEKFMGVVDTGWGETVGGEGIKSIGMWFSWIIYSGQGVVFGLVIFVSVIWLGVVWGFYMQ